MQIDKKLEVFHDSIIEVAEQESRMLTEEYQSELREELNAFRKRKQEEQEKTFQLEEARIRREINSRVSREVTRQKRRLDQSHQEKKQKLFEEVERQLSAYRKTEAYDAYLTAKIAMAKGYARDEEIIIYIDPEDAGKKAALEQKTNAPLTVSEITFGGGIRAVIRARNVLIDESFATKTAQEREDYTF